MVETITRQSLLQMISSGIKFKLVDVLNKENFEREHIKGAISLPLKDIQKMAARFLQKTDKIVVYCASFECPASTQAAEKLISLGYKDVLDYKGGLKDYKEAGLPLETSFEKTKCACCC